MGRTPKRFGGGKDFFGPASGPTPPDFAEESKQNLKRGSTKCVTPPPIFTEEEQPTQKQGSTKSANPYRFPRKKNSPSPLGVQLPEQPPRLEAESAHGKGPNLRITK